MSSTADDIARLAAQRLSGEHPKLPAEVEVQLQAGEAPKRFDPLSLSIALAALLVSASKAAWDVYRDVKSDKKEPPAREVVERRLRIAFEAEDGVPAAQKDRVFAVVVEEAARKAART